MPRRGRPARPEAAGGWGRRARRTPRRHRPPPRPVALAPAWSRGTLLHVPPQAVEHLQPAMAVRVGVPLLVDLQRVRHGKAALDDAHPGAIPFGGERELHRGGRALGHGGVRVAGPPVGEQPRWLDLVDNGVELPELLAGQHHRPAGTQIHLRLHALEPPADVLWPGQHLPESFGRCRHEDLTLDAIGDHLPPFPADDVLPPWLHMHSCQCNPRVADTGWLEALRLVEDGYRLADRATSRSLVEGVATETHVAEAGPGRAIILAHRQGAGASTRSRTRAPEVGLS